MKELLQEAKGKKFATASSIFKNIEITLKDEKNVITQEYKDYYKILKSLKKTMEIVKNDGVFDFYDSEIAWEDLRIVLAKDKEFKKYKIADTKFKHLMKFK